MNLIQEQILEEAAACGMSELQLNAILGSLMGDACIPKSETKETARLQWNHSWKQKDYCIHKYETLKLFATGEPRRRDNPGFGDELALLTLKSSRLLRLIHSIVYPHDGPRRMTREHLEMITHPVALAWLFLDNGCRAKKHNCGGIAQNGFPEEDVDLLIDWMGKQWGVYAVKRRVRHTSTGKESCNIGLNTKAYIKLMRLIEPYIPESMRYKTEVFMRECPVCGEKFPKSHHECCSPACTQVIREERKKEYEIRTHDHRMEKARIWSMKHREEINAAARETYKKISPEQREELNARARAYRGENPEQYREKRRNYYERVKNDPHYIELRKGENTRHYHRVKEDPIRHEHMLMLQRLRRKDPEIHAKEMEAQRRHRAMVNADPVKKAARLERDRLARKKYMQNPEARAKAQSQKLE